MTTSTDPRPSPLHAVHAELGGAFTDFAGWNMPLRYGSELAEHKAVRTAAGLFDLSHMAEIAVTGDEACAALCYALVGNIGTVKIGRARYSMLCNEQGGVLDDLVTYRTGETDYLVVANAANHDVVLRELTARAASSVGSAATVTDRTFETALIALQGPASAAILAERTDADLTGLRYYAAMPATVAGHEVLLARTGYTGEDGFELYLPNEQAPDLWAALHTDQVTPCGLASRDTLRLEAGMPLYGNELDTETTPAEAGLGRVVRFDKEGDFVGRAALAAATPRKHLVGLRGTGRRAPRHGYPVLDGGHAVGTVTSGALSPTLGYPIALGYTATETAEGTELTVDIRGRSTETVTVVPAPFYNRKES